MKQQRGGVFHGLRRSFSSFVSNLKPADGAVVEEREDAANLEVYVVARPFLERGMAIVRQHPNLALQIGVCHFLTVFKTKNGGLYQFDFGPTGGRHIQTQGGPLAWLLNEGDQRRRDSPINGEIRELKLADLPENHLYLGKSKLTIEDIRNFNSTQSKNYELNINDCRHYVNNVVWYTTGVQSASVQLVRDHFRKKKDELPHFSSNIVRLLQIMTNVSNWSKIKATGNATMATILCLTGPGVAARARAALARPALLHLAKQPARKIAFAALASAAVSCPQVPIMKRMTHIGYVLTNNANRLVAGAGSTVEGAGRRVSRVMIGRQRELPYLRSKGRMMAAGTKLWL